ncbi:TetR family transcriptional regulator [Klenkia sp. PcliD-1-E]|uniref:TetR family transcriptional regulator n=1 Tax=Klenkia sp. PcliD-1-E TaxID=2954492 RepID=UPI0020972C17|nr:TetR family transcriptional regulator [Klenkia sp. PcliD-1-E]MCO7218569.1 TetR family transcriptional regulator [Klenkia sp. PcliD-1-E]
MSASDFNAEVRLLRLHRVLDASVEIITERGWDGLSMTAVARRAGVTRQGLYKDVGDRAALGRAVVAHEVARFLGWVQEGFEAHPGRVEDGISAAARMVLERGRDNALVLSILRPDRDSGLLALVTVDPDVVLGHAIGLIQSMVGGAVPDALIDSVVRLTVSHLLQPTVGVDEAVDRISMVGRVFGRAALQVEHERR